MVLNGIKVIDTTRWAFGPFCATCLSDMGADVIKIEDPESGDGVRYVHKTRDLPLSTSNPMIEYLNRGKRGLALRLDKEQGREILYQLIETTDVFITAQRPHSQKKLGIDYETLCRINPRIIYAICGAWGEKGPLRDKPAWDGAAFARSGLMHILQDKNGYPPVCPPGMGDLTAGISMAYGIAMALFHRERTGKGQKVDVSLLGSMITVMEALCLQVSLATGKEYPQYDSSKPGNPLNFTYRTKDNRWILLNMHHTNEFWHIFCEVVGITRYEKDKRFSDHITRCDHALELKAILDEAFLKEDLAYWVEIFGKTDLVWAPIQTLNEARDDPQVIENEFILSYMDPITKKQRKTPGVPIKLSEGNPEINFAYPELGQHTEEILLEMGYSWDDMAELKDAKIIP